MHVRTVRVVSGQTEDQHILNLGLHDELTGLKWVQRNIEHFGGDKSKVIMIY